MGNELTQNIGKLLNVTKAYTDQAINQKLNQGSTTNTSAVFNDYMIQSATETTLLTPQSDSVSLKYPNNQIFNQSKITLQMFQVQNKDGEAPSLIEAPTAEQPLQFVPATGSCVLQYNTITDSDYENICTIDLANIISDIPEHIYCAEGQLDIQNKKFIITKLLHKLTINNLSKTTQLITKDYYRFAFNNSSNPFFLKAVPSSEKIMCNRGSFSKSFTPNTVYFNGSFNFTISMERPKVKEGESETLPTLASDGTVGSAEISNTCNYDAEKEEYTTYKSIENSEKDIALSYFRYLLNKWNTEEGEVGLQFIHDLQEPIVVDIDINAVSEKQFILNSQNAKITEITIPNDKKIILPPQTSWEKNLLTRIDQMLIPKPLLSDMDQASGNTGFKYELSTGVNYSSVHYFPSQNPNNPIGKRAGVVGTQVPLSTYYSALENPASVMYQHYKYNEGSSISTYYGVNCSGFVSYVGGFNQWHQTDDEEYEGSMAYKWKGRKQELTTYEDLYKVSRGDILLNTFNVGANVSDPINGNHVRIVRDVIYSSVTGKLLGFNIAESWKPYCMITFYTAIEFLNQFKAPENYRLVKLTASEKLELTNIETIQYSTSIYPDKGDKGHYMTGKNVEFYIPDHSHTATKIICGTKEYPLDGDEVTEIKRNGVTVYQIPLTEKEETQIPGTEEVQETIVNWTPGTYQFYIDTNPTDPCTIIVEPDTWKRDFVLKQSET